MNNNLIKGRFMKLTALISFPLSTEVVVVDTTGLSSNFRNRILQIAEENNYKGKE